MDIDECDVGNDCNRNAICSNTFGSYDCKCIDGFLGDGYECHDEVKGFKLIISNLLLDYVILTLRKMNVN